MRSDGPELIIVVIHIHNDVCTGPKALMMLANTEVGAMLAIKLLGEKQSIKIRPRAKCI
jgi:hypothetical protein